MRAQGFFILGPNLLNVNIKPNKGLKAQIIVLTQQNILKVQAHYSLSPTF
jgi:hypothetical protein